MFHFSMPVVWLVALVLFCIIEGATTTALVSIWFAVGAFCALVVSIASESPALQVAVFHVVSAAAFALLRPLARRYFTPKMQATNADRCIGQQAVVTETVDNLAGTGQVSLKGRVWSARGESDAPIPPETCVTVLRIEGVKVIVKPIA